MGVGADHRYTIEAIAAAHVGYGRLFRRIAELGQVAYERQSPSYMDDDADRDLLARISVRLEFPTCNHDGGLAVPYVRRLCMT